MEYEDPQDIQKYIWCMTEIKHRIEVIENFINETNSTGQLPTDIEFIALQYRKILELIALASICANKQLYSEKRNNFFADWHGKRILDDLEKVNPNFYPVPTKQILDDKTGRVIAVEKIQESYLTKELYIELYDKCGNLLHSFNPYSEYPDFESLKDELPIWKDRIVRLLNHHQIQLVNSNKQLWVLMQSEDDGKVHVAEMKKTEKRAV